MGMTLLAYITKAGGLAPFGLPATEELTGRSAVLPGGGEVRFGGETAVKCDDDLFLAEQGGRILLLEEGPEESLKAQEAEALTADAAVLPEELEGWETELCFAPGYVLTAAFRNGALALHPSPEPVLPGAGEADAGKAPEAPDTLFPLQAAETGEKRFLLRFPETGETVFLDGRRFLFYAILEGRIVTGFAELPARE